SIFLHRVTELKWAIDMPPEIGAAFFDTDGAATRETFLTGARSSLKKGRRIAAYLKQNNVKAVIVNGYSDTCRLWLCRFCPRHGMALFMRSDSNIKGERLGSAWKRWMKRMLVGWVVRQCDGILPMGTWGLEYYLKYGADRSRCHFVPAEPDYGAFENATPEAIAEFQRKRRLAPDRKRLLFSGRLIPLKRVDLLIDDFARIAASRPDWDLVIVGDGELRETLVAGTPAAVANRVHWMGFLDMAELPLAYRASSVLVLPSNREAWALVLPEAMASGMPVVASDQVGASRDMIEEGVNGRVFRSEDLEDLVAALADVTDPDKYPGYREATPRVFQQFRRERDPVAGVRRALTSAGLLPA
ncbi:MAG: glycosyltransferase family 4 protein, partial [Phycisphaerales bacterium]|nr:glycosyltransferase family 4 protein [Phycisphaerales bacterium]